MATRQQVQTAVGAHLVGGLGAGSAADLVHMPVDRETGRDPARTRELVDAATAGGGGLRFGVATECGMARIDERGPGGPSLERLLELHVEVAAPVR